MVKKTIFRIFLFILVVSGIGGGIYLGSHKQWNTRLISCCAYPFLQCNRLLAGAISKKSDLSVHAEVAALKRQNMLLQMQNIRLRAALGYMGSIKELAEFNERYRKNGRIAQVMARHFSDDSHYFLVDAGSQKGIAKDMVVIYGNNLIGKITDVYPWYSKACLITDRHCKVAAYCSRTQTHGIYEGLNNQDKATLNFVDHLAPIERGDLVISSGEGLVFPQGFALGRIVSSQDNGLCKQVAVEPLCDLQAIDYCLVIAKK